MTMQHQVEGLSVLIPVHNQGSILQQVISVWSGFLHKLERPYEIILVDDGSTDSTPQLIDGVDGRIGLAGGVPHLRALRLPNRQGFGAALRAGLKAAQQPLVFYTGCDFAYNPADLKKLLHSIERSDPESGRKIDVVNGFRCGPPVVGWRRLLGRCRRVFFRVAFGFLDQPGPSWISGKAHRYAILIRAFFAVRIGDIDSKFKLLRRKIFERIPIQSSGDFVHAEILAKANFLGCLMDELPIAERPGPFPAHAEPSGPASRGKELRRVFFHPDFGPTIVGAPPITISPTALPAATEGAAYPSTALTASGGSGTGYSFAITAGSAAGLVLNSEGVLSGTPSTTAGSPFCFTVTATDSNGATGSQEYSLTVAAKALEASPAT